MKPPFDSSGGGTPSKTSPPGGAASPGGAAPGGGSTPGSDLLPDMPDVPGLDDLPGLDELPACLPGTCDALWNAVDRQISPVTALADKALAQVDKTQAAVTAATDKAATYAQQYLDNPAMVASGLMSVVSTQAACAIEEAAKAADKLAPGATDALKGYTDQAGGYLQDGKDAVGAANKTVTDAILPASQFYKDNGLDKLKECGSTEGRPEMPDMLTDAFEQIDKKTAEGARAGADMIANYEQGSAVEKAIYEAERYGSQFGGMADDATGALSDAIPGEMPMSSSCGGSPIPFIGSLLDPDARSRYYHQLMNTFEDMGERERDKMIDEIAKKAKP